jgi:hypothetical protein
MTYLKYANLCAEVLRGSLKEPFLTKARAEDERARAMRNACVRAVLALTRAAPRPTGQAAGVGVLQEHAVRDGQGGQGWCAARLQRARVRSV